MSKLKLGIIGVGNMGSGHMTSILEGKCPDIELVAIAEIKDNKKAIAKEKLSEEVEIYDSGEELLEKSSVDAVLVATPHYSHPRLSIMALEKNIHVLCEKPAGVFTKDVNAMLEVAKKSTAVLAMMFNQRTNCVYRKMKEIVDSGEYGDIRRVNWIITNWFRTQYYYDSGEWRATWDGEGGGVLLNQCPHNLDLLQWICGMPTKLQSFMYEGKWHDIEVEDDVTTFMEFANGATGVFVTSTADAPGTNRFEITLDGAKLVAENDVLTIHKLDKLSSDILKNSTEAFAKIEPVVETVETDGENLQHIGVMNAFAGNILRGEALVAKGEEGINGLMLSNAMHLSSWTNKAVTLPIDEDLYLELLTEKRKNSRKKEDLGIVSNTAGSY